MAKIAILGFGVVGSGVAETISLNENLIESRIGKEISIKYILDLRDFPGNRFESLVIHDFNIILNDPEVTIVAEMMGGSHPAYDFTLACLKAGKSVVTSNKEVVANFGAELLEVARENHVRYMFEASVGGGIPLIRPMVNDLAANSIRTVDGILNGTTNYILTKMANGGTDFETALKDAQKNGYAEANPAADIEGLDAARKIVILAALAFGKLISPSVIHTEGITSITEKDTSVAKALGYSVKLIAHSECIDGKILAMVSPRLVRNCDPLGSVNDVFNGILIDTDVLGQTMFYGRGAGKMPTASAVVADIIDIAKSPENDKTFPVFRCAAENDIAQISSYCCRHLLRLNLSDRKLKVEINHLEEYTVDDSVVLITDSISESEAERIRKQFGEAICSDLRLL